MLPKQNRISSKRDIKHLFRRGRRSRSRLLSVIFDQNQHSCNRFAFLISKAKVKKATQRNRIKRKIANFILREKAIKVTSGFGKDIIVIVNQMLSKEQEDQYLIEFKTILAKIESN